MENNNNKNSYIIPPNMNEKFLIFRMTVLEFSIVVILFFVFVKGLTLGHPQFFLFPCIAAVLFIRAFENGKNSLQILTTEIRYYTMQKCYCFRGEDYEPDDR